MLDSSYSNEPLDQALYVDSLESVRPDQLDGVRVVYCSSIGMAGHIEVICGIRGIKVVDINSTLESPATSTVSATVNANPNLDFQISAYEVDDLLNIDLSRVKSVFLRSEHMLYRLHSAGVEVSWSNAASLIDGLSELIAEFASALPKSTELVFRGADIRSDDRLLASLFHERRENNPELGVHGVRALIKRPEWVDLEVASLQQTAANWRYAVPFVTRLAEYDAFGAVSSKWLGSSTPFLESPAALVEAARDPTKLPANISVGLKDVSQFYFAQSRSDSNIDRRANLGDDELVSFVCGAIRAICATGRTVSLYQTQETLAKYNAALEGVRWTVSMNAADFRSLNSLEAGAS